MKSLWRYVLVILVSVKCVANQCIDKDNECDCHCSCCIYPWCVTFVTRHCTSCAKGWSGTTSNGCQRQNIAYLSTATSVSARNKPQYAIDEDDSSYFWTNDVINPQLTLKLPGLFNIRYIYVYLYMEIYNNYDVYVMNSSNTLSNGLLCTSFSDFNGGYKKVNITCDRCRTCLGDQIAIIRRIDRGVLIVHELKVYQCSVGTYGYLCENQCQNCQDNRCDGYTGICLSSCNPGWYGGKCDRKCSLDCETSFCDSSLGCTNCLLGYSGPTCKRCFGGSYGKNCSFTCQNCLNCDSFVGCTECKNGWYGVNCNVSCPTSCLYDRCDKDTGNCTDGCKDGFMGTDCKTPCKGNCATCNKTDPCFSCVSGKFGAQCEHTCSNMCGGNKSCNKVNGQCFDCIFGTFGPNCTENCSKYCFEPSVCHINGTCIGGCVDEWIGLKCDTKCSIDNCARCTISFSGVSCEICKNGHYLDNGGKCKTCSSKCITCVSESNCTQCIPNYFGEQCNTKCNINCVDGLCQIDGTCIYGCNNSKHGVGCTEDCIENCEHCYNIVNCTKCLPGYWGINCRETCNSKCFNCTTSYGCDTCKPGSHGVWCNFKCPPQCITCESKDSCTSCKDGWSGQFCNCSKNCKNEKCDDNGKCLNECKDSFYGDYCTASCPSNNCLKCDQMSGNCTVCSKGLYGINCTEKCRRSCLGSACDMSGACLQGCEDGFAGNLCTECEY